MITPCYQCPERSRACWDYCERYAQFKAGTEPGTADKRAAQVDGYYKIKKTKPAYTRVWNIYRKGEK